MRKLLGVHEPKNEFVELRPEVVNFMLEKMLVLSINFCENACKEDMSGFGNSNYTDAFKNMLEAWLDIVGICDNRNPHQQLIRNYTTIIFNKFIETHLANYRQVEESIIEELDEVTEKDRDLYKEQLIIIGFFGRLNLEHSLTTLANLMDSKIQLLCSQLSCLNPNTSFNASIEGSLSVLFEDLHWILLITGTFA